MGDKDVPSVLVLGFRIFVGGLLMIREALPPLSLMYMISGCKEDQL